MRWLMALHGLTQRIAGWLRRNPPGSTGSGWLRAAQRRNPALEAQALANVAASGNRRLLEAYSSLQVIATELECCDPDTDLARIEQLNEQGLAALRVIEQETGMQRSAGGTN